MSDMLKLGPLALGISLGGVLLAVVIAMSGRLWGENFYALAHLVFAAAQVAAIVLGVMSRDRMGRAAAITSGVLLVGSLMFVA